MVVAVAAAAAAGGCGDPAPAGLSLTPSSPVTTSTLQFEFTAPDDSGPDGSILKGYTLSVTGPTRRGCASVRADPLPAIKNHEHVHVTVAPPSGGHWCAGKFTAQVEELARPVCTPGTPCPQFVRLVDRVGRVKFRIAR